jgi:hypothetical protein
MSGSYAQFFIIRPVDNDGIIWTEFVRMITKDTPGGHLKQIVQLVRDN